MRVYMAVCGLAVLALIALPGSASAAAKAGLTKCKATEKDRQIFLLPPDMRVQNITCDKARQKILYKDPSGQRSGGKGCDTPTIEPGRNCRFKLSGFSCVSTTDKSQKTTTKCSKKKAGKKTQKVNVKYQTGLG